VTQTRQSPRPNDRRGDKQNQGQDATGCTSNVVHRRGSPATTVAGYTPTGPATSEGHFHPEGNTPADLQLTNCTDYHKPKVDGRSITACRDGAWAFAYWPKEKMPQRVKLQDGRTMTPAFRLDDVGGELTRFRCKSWRCDLCRPWVFKRDFARIMDALESRTGWLYAVLTLNPKRWRAGKRAAYKNFWRAWRRLRHRLARFLGVPVEYIAVMERQRSGWPHMNLALHWRGMELIEDLETYAVGIERWMKDNAPSCGLGFSVYCQELDNQKNIAGYFTGQSFGKKGNGPVRDEDPDAGGGDLRQLAGELNKKGYQLPVDAAYHFRRIRSSPGLLPPIKNGDEYSGAIWKAAVKGGEGAPGDASEPGTRARAGARSADAVRGSGGRAPGTDAPEGRGGYSTRPRAKRGARPRKEYQSHRWCPGNPEWHRIARVTREAFEKSDYSEAVILAELRKLKAEWEFLQN